MLQQLKNTKNNKQITKEDCGYIAYASCLNFFHTDSMFSPYTFGVYYSMDLYWVKRISDNEYLYQLSYGLTNKTSPGYCCGIAHITPEKVRSMHPDLVCGKDGDERLLIECSYRKLWNFNKNKIGFFLLSPQDIINTEGNVTENISIYRLVITPKPGLFPAKNEP